MKRKAVKSVKKVKKAVRKALKQKSNFLKHEALIVAGASMEFQGWWEASRECADKFRGNASAYAKASMTESHSVTTIRQYVGVCLALSKKAGTTDWKDAKAFFEYKVGYAYTNMGDVRSFINSGKPSNKGKTRKVRTITVTPNKVRSVLAKNGVSKSVIDRIVADLA